MCKNLFFIILIIHCSFLNNVKCFWKKPNIVFIIVDDVGRNDFSLHGSNQIPTPNIDALGYNGVIFNRHYSMHICTPSRSVLLTGNHAIRSGMQGFPLSAGEPRALPVWMPTLPEKLKKLGYVSHMIGKWHIGHQNRSVTPLGRGFKSHVGYWNGFCGYFDYLIKDHDFEGFDLHKNFAPLFEEKGAYATDLFTRESIKIINKHDTSIPLFLYISHLAGHTGANGTELGTPDPNGAHQKFSYIKNERRRLYADVINRLDDSVGKIVEALNRRHMLQNTIVVFISDNGAPTVGMYDNVGSNWPFRGIKATLNEGGILNSGLIWSKNLRKKQKIDNTVFHISDWMPTLYAAAGGDVRDLGKIDGINHWPLLINNREIQNKNRPNILLNIDEVLKFEGVLSWDGRYKLTKGHYSEGTYDSYYGDSGNESGIPEYNTTAVLASKVNIAIRRADFLTLPLTRSTIKNLREKLVIKQSTAPRENLTCDVCLFDLENDPTETTNIAKENPRIVEQLMKSLSSYRNQLRPQTNKPVDPQSNPAFCNDTWFTWLDPVHKCDWLGTDLAR